MQGIDDLRGIFEVLMGNYAERNDETAVGNSAREANSVRCSEFPTKIPVRSVTRSAVLAFVAESSVEVNKLK